ncbi:MAG: hypothetical protein HY268_13325 [Deltaproteobacteria bacterium]|nr:hypothetical protein [Deltaproteobacteria bacterium]
MHMLPVPLHPAHLLLQHLTPLGRDVRAAFNGFTHGSHFFLHLSELSLELLDLGRARGRLLG